MEESKEYHPRKVVEESSPYSRFGKDVINELKGNTSRIRGMSSLFSSNFNSTREPGSVSGMEQLKSKSRVFGRIILFIVFVLVLYSWNLKLFNLADFQRIIHSEEKCIIMNRFDYTEKSWLEMLIVNNHNNIRSQEDVCQKKVKPLKEFLGNMIKEGIGSKFMLGNGKGKGKGKGRGNGNGEFSFSDDEDSLK